MSRTLGARSTIQVVGAGIAAGFLVLAAWSAAAEEKAPDPETDTGVTLSIDPLKPTYFNEDRIEVRFRHRVTRDLPPGKAEVRLRNVDTGKDLVKTFPIEFHFGVNHEWAAWGGAGSGTSSKGSALDEMLDGEVVLHDEVPDGFYLPLVKLIAADGTILAEKQYTPEQVTHLIRTGEVSRKISKSVVDSKVADMQGWYDGLKTLEARAREAGADTSLPHLMLTAMKETIRQMPSRVAAMEFDIVFDNHAYCAVQVPKTRMQLEKLIADPASGIAADIFPRPRERLSFKDGYFHAGDQPVFMMGQCMFALWPDLDVMREMGFNLVHIGVNPLCLFPDSDDVAATRALAKARSDAIHREASANAALGLDIDAAVLLDDAQSGATAAASAADASLRIEDVVLPEPTGKLLVADYNDPELTVRRFLDRCQELGIKVDLGLNMHPVPEWFFEKYPAARLQGYSVAGFIPFDIEHPASLAFTERFLDIAMKAVAGHPALNSIWLANEPTLINNGPLSAALFREAMKRKYETVDKLNEMWQTKYVGFDSITLPLKNAGKGAVDFWWFNLGRLNHFFEFMQQCVRKYDKTVNTCFKLNNLQMGWYCPPMNVDQEGVSDLSEIVGMDSGTYPFAKPYYDWLRSLSPEKPVVNLEFKGGGKRTRLDIWKGALHGLAAIDWWCWHPKPAFSRAMCDTVALHEGPLAMANIQRNIEAVMAFQKFPRSPFVVVYPDPVLPRAWTYFQTHTPVVNAIKRLGYAVDYATEKRIAKGRLDTYTYDIIVLPAANCIRDETFESIGAFVKRGGMALVVGDLPRLDPMERPRDLGWLKAPDDAKTVVTSGTNSVTFAYGAGQVWITPTDTEKVLLTRLGEIAGQKLPQQPITVSPEFEHRTIAWTNARGEDVLLTYIVNEWEGGGDRPVEIHCNIKIKKAFDLVTNTPIDPAKVTLPPYGVLLIEWEPER